MFTLDHVLKKGNGGRLEPDFLYDALLPYQCGPDSTDVQLPLQVPAAGTKTIRFPCPSNQAGYERIGTGLEVNQLVFADSTDGTANANFTVWLRDPFGREFSNFPMHVLNLFGTANYAARLREPFAFFQAEVITAQLAKITGGATNIWPFLSGVQYNPKSLEQRAFCDKRLAKWIKRRERVYPYYFTPANPAVLTALQSVSFEKKLSDSIFEVFTLCAVSTGAFTFEITEVQSGQTLMNGAISNQCALGSAQLPTVLPMPYMLMKGSQLRITLTDLSNGGNNIYLALCGRKIVNVPLQEFKALERETCDIVPMADSYSPIIVDPLREIR